MARRGIGSAVAGLLLFIGCTPAATAFSFTFEWGGIPSCTDGYPNEVPNPAFTLVDVPPGTQTIEFEMTDLRLARYYHGGGTVTCTGASVMDPGAVRYNSPRPPRGKRTYEWVGVAKDASGKTLGSATARRDYPE